MSYLGPTARGPGFGFNRRGAVSRGQERRGDRKKSVCTVCEQLEQRSTVANVIQVSCREDLKKGKSKDEIIESFVKAINALINEGEGIIYVHLGDPNLLGLLDEAVDDKLMKLIPDDTMYDENFYRRYYDQDHVLFRVKPVKRNIHSMTDACTRASLNRGLADLTHAQFYRLLSLVARPRSTDDDGATSRPQDTPAAFGEPKPDQDAFEKDKEVVIKAGQVSVPFQESLGLQAKRIIRSKTKETYARLTELFWCHLPHYITAFSKRRAGGSVYFGLREDKHEESARETKSGKFLCEGIRLSRQECEQLERRIKQKVKDTMKWIGHPEESPSDPIKVLFHKVKVGMSSRERDLWVVEIAVRYVHGIAFYNQQGPLVYKLSSGEPEPLQTEEWIESYGKELTVHEVSFSQT